MRVILALVIGFLAIAVLAFLVRGTLAVDTDLHVQRLDLLQRIANLDDGLDRAVTLEITSALLDSRKQRSELSKKMGAALEELETGPLALRGLGAEVENAEETVQEETEIDPEVDVFAAFDEIESDEAKSAIDAALDEFQEKIGDKFGLAFDFESKTNRGTERLIRSVDSVNAFIGQLRLLTDDRQVLNRIGNLQYALTTYSISPKPSQIVSTTVEQRRDDIKALSAEQSEEFQDLTKKLMSSINDVIVDKTELVQLLNQYLSIPTAQTLQNLEQVYIEHHEEQVAVANQFRTYLAGYSAILLLLLVWVGIRLRRSYYELDRANETLEEQVRERTADLSTALDDLKESQAQLVQSEKMASLGQMVAGVAHEINTPLGYARSNGEIVRESLKSIREVCQAQQRVMDLMNAPDASDDEIASAIENAMQLESQIQTGDLTDELDNLLGDSEHGLTHIAGLVESLKDFSRVDRSRDDLYDVNEGVRSTLRMCRNHIKAGTRVSTALGELPEIECSPSQVNQVLMNLLTNAAQAVEDNGRIYVHTTAEDGGVGIRILDNGSGMPEEVREKVFDPFFTTKPIGEGTGLGLSISFRIVEDHGGRISVKSVPGKGSEFIVWLPVKQDEAGGQGDSEGSDEIPVQELAASA